MKKLFLTFFAVFIILLGLFVLAQRPSLYHAVLIQKENSVPPFAFKAYYSDPTASRISAFNLTPSLVTPIRETFLSYTEGFIPKAVYKRYEKSLLALNPSLTSRMPHDIYEDDTFIIFSFTGGLESIYIVNKLTLEVHPLHYSPSQDLGVMYVSHIKRLEDKLLILGGEAKANHALIYTINLSNFTVEKSKRLPTHKDAINDKHYTLTEAGDCVFIRGNTLQVYNPFSERTTLIPLTFIATQVHASDSGFLVTGKPSLEEHSESLSYTLFDNSLKVLEEGALLTPSPTFNIVDILLQDHFLYLTTFDPKGSLYLNYFSVYNLSTKEMVYCLGLGDLFPRILLDVE